MTLRCARLLPLVAALLAVAACDEARRPPEVEVMTVRPTVPAERHELPGVFRESRPVPLGFPAGGRVTEVAVRAGDEVGRGALLATLERGGDGDAGGRLALRAPVPGTVEAPLARPGDTVAARDPVLRLVPDAALEVLVQAPGPLAARLRVGQRVTLRIPVLGTELPGAVVRIEGLSPVTGEHPVTLVPRETGTAAVDGISAEAIFTLPDPEAEPVIAVPLSALVAGRDGGRYVYRLDPATRRVERVPVRTGNVVGAMIAVGGLAAGDTVVVRGLDSLADGRRVRPVPADPVPGARSRTRPVP